MDIVTRQSSDLLTASAGRDTPIPAELQAICRAAGCADCGLEEPEFATILVTVGTRLNYGAAPGIQPSPAQKQAFYSALHLNELALAQACALGRERAWERFLTLYRQPLTAAAIAIAGNATAGHELADSLYSELFGLSERDGVRRSPLASYTGRGSLLGWLRTTLAQRHVDRFRRTRHEIPLGDFDAPAADPAASQPDPATAPLRQALGLTLQALPPDDRFLLAAYYLDRQTLLTIARMLSVHEATISRRLKRLLIDLRKQLLQNLQAGGMSRRAAEEALGTDPRDLEVNEINLRDVLQDCQRPPFSTQENAAATNPTYKQTS